MYPHPFRPSTKCSLSDDRGHTVINCDLQLFKPLLGCAFNGIQQFIVGHDIPNKAGAIIRGLVTHSSASLLDIKPGPAYWSSGIVPYIVLNEDPNGLKWNWLDAVPWDYTLAPTPMKLWSFFAAVDYVPPPPPPPPVLINLGATSATAAPIAFGTVYAAVLPPLAAGWAAAALATGTGYTITTLPGAPAGLGTSGWGGNRLFVMAGEGTPIVGPGTVPVAGVFHTGPDAGFQWANPGPGAAAFTFRVDSP